MSIYIVPPFELYSSTLEEMNVKYTYMEPRLFLYFFDNKTVTKWGIEKEDYTTRKKSAMLSLVDQQH
jgi:hypothetical protein